MTGTRCNATYLLIFRELHNEQPQLALRMKFLAGITFTLEDPRGGGVRQVRVPSDGCIGFEIRQPADFFTPPAAPAKGP